MPKHAARRPRKQQQQFFRQVFLAIQALFLAALLVAIAFGRPDCDGLTGADLEACRDTAPGAGGPAAMVLLLWANVTVALGVIGLIERYWPAAAPFKRVLDSPRPTSVSTSASRGRGRRAVRDLTAHGPGDTPQRTDDHGRRVVTVAPPRTHLP
ncbi:hypothetical protein [Prauserella cavernicola]|uniref:Uncharacterized protein n=1 Tax=Prauserella cavernicola TaxID=2800127 RepID=A0A934QR60_9PSEU|nr:hypothetical protein [Prauserella cavernicola]MBK1783953.1 hypothetical protein [Prauserella cavernicola]